MGVPSSLKAFKKVGGIPIIVCVLHSPDLAFPVGLVAKKFQKPTKAAYAAVTQILLYAHNTRNTPLTLGGRNADITAFCYSDLGGCQLTRRSAGGYAVFLGFGIVAWFSKLHNSVALNIFEAEYMTLSEISKSELFLRLLL